MKPGTGRMAVVMPQGVLFRGGAEKAIRQRMLESGLFDAVIGLLAVGASISVDPYAPGGMSEWNLATG